MQSSVFDVVNNAMTNKIYATQQKYKKKLEYIEKNIENRRKYFRKHKQYYGKIFYK